MTVREKLEQAGACPEALEWMGARRPATANRAYADAIEGANRQRDADCVAADHALARAAQRKIA